MILESDNRKPLRLEIGITIRVVLLATGCGVWFSIALHDELGLGAEKVADVFAELVLSPELRVAKLPISQQRPKQFFRRCLLPPQLPRFGCESGKVEPAPVILTPFSPWEKGWDKGGGESESISLHTLNHSWFAVSDPMRACRPSETTNTAL